MKCPCALFVDFLMYLCIALHLIRASGILL